MWPFNRYVARPSIGSTEVTKPRVRIRPDGWVRHLGGSFPFDSRAFVEVIYAGGYRSDGASAERADTILTEWWQQRATHPRWNVLFYRIVSPPRLAEVQP